ncbi:amino acid adenylation protein [Gordonia sp. 852002-51296_SCH5728562-b]|nr:amino acid adenylation protein [Gordonia sp. 852002-51296_SCH5728562-b]
MPHSIPAEFLLSAKAAPARTLCDILDATTARHPDAPAIDDGDQILTYSQLSAVVRRGAARLAQLGVRRGSRVGIRMPSGSRDLYTAILSVLYAGAAYVPVDADDPEERATLVFGEAKVDAIADADGIHVTDGASPDPAATSLTVSSPDASTPDSTTPDSTTPDSTTPDSVSTGATSTADSPDANRPTPGDDAWIIFTSGSTGTPKGVAVTHRNAAAFVDAEATMFCRDEPLGPGDRVLAGLSVAFDASCEEMWLAWRHGACLVPAPRSLVRSGMDLGPWLVARDITVVSTVPTLASLWPPEALEAVRLLIFGGEACPPELADRLAVEGREVWNTYGPTEATVVACAALLGGPGPIRIGLPLPGWDLAVVGADGLPVAEGETGELIIGGVGLAHYLDPAKDAEKYAPMPTLGWERAYRSGDLVRLDREGLVFGGRADDQVKVGGRRIELGEIDNALQHLPGVSGAATAVRKTAAGNSLLVGYLVSPDPEFDVANAHRLLAEQLPAPMIPRLALVDELPTRTSGKVDRDALPWPLPGTDNSDDEDASDLSGTEAWLAARWTDVLGATVTSAETDFFAEGGGSLAAAQLVTAVRERYPEITVADLYDHPRLGSLAEFLGETAAAEVVDPREVKPTPAATGFAQLLLSVPLSTLTGLQWATWLGVVNNVGAWAARRLDVSVPWLVEVNWWVVLVAFLVFITPPGRMVIAAIGSRILLGGVESGTYPRGGNVHIRLWVAERLLVASGAANLSGAPWMIYLARALGSSVGRGVDLHTIPPVTGKLTIGDGASVEPEVDVAGWWIDGDLVHIGEIVIKRGATIGARSTLAPGAVVGKDAEVGPGSAVFGRVKAGQQWAGSPAVKIGKATHSWPDHRPRRASFWVPVYGLSSMVLAAIPLISLGVGLLVIGTWALHADRLRDVAIRSLILLPAAAIVSLAVFAAITAVLVRAMSLGLEKGYHPVRSRTGWQVWMTERLLDSARTYLFPLYAGLLTPWWFRILGAKVGKGTEISTALVLPKFTTIADGAFLADDTMVASYELGGGWMHIDDVKIGKRSFLGNSGMAAPGRKVPKNGLVAVLSAAPDRAKSGSSWLGSPPIRLRRTAAETDTSRTFDPPMRLKVARAVIETLRLIPVMISFGLGIFMLLSLQYIAQQANYVIAGLVSGLLLVLCGAIACCIAAAAKWAVVGRIEVSEHPLWSSFVWRNELSDAFVETVAAPWFANAATGTPILNLWLRLLGAQIGKGVWCETYWLPEADLVSLGAGATVERGCVVQTHLFHDRVMAIDRVVLADGATLGPHCVALPASGLGESATVGPASLVMRGDVVPAHTRWQGNPIAPWHD